MSRPLLGCIADDYTGATDLASMLTRAGLRVIQCFGPPEGIGELLDYDAIVVALKSRSIAPQEAVAQSLEALAVLQSLGIERFFFKYCSTFDSTAQGNIGPVADALAHATRSKQVLFCPAFPENGRTVYCGHLFVNGVPLHESSMRNHPLNPMTDSDLVRVLQAQSKRPVAPLSLGASLPASAQDQHFIVDTISNEDLTHAAELAKHHRLLTGGSAIARYWATTILAEQFKLPGAENRDLPNAGIHDLSTVEQASLPGSRDEVHPCVVLAGSCSDATRQQVAAFEKLFPVLHLELASTKSLEELVDESWTWCHEHWQNSKAEKLPLLVTTSAKPELVEASRAKLGDKNAAEFAEQVLARLAKKLQANGVRKFIVAGGETAGAIINSLGIRAVRIGREIAPGVPWITTLSPPHLTLTLKSGNFGGPHFFLDAMELSV
jgi:3-dehydrotetronate 4-kinase